MALFSAVRLTDQTNCCRDEPSLSTRIASMSVSRQIKRCRGWQVLAIPSVANRLLEPVAALLPHLNCEIVSNCHIIEPVRPIFAQPNLTVFAFDSRVGI